MKNSSVKKISSIPGMKLEKKKRILKMKHVKSFLAFYVFKSNKLRWPNTVCARFTDSVSDAIEETQSAL